MSMERERETASAVNDEPAVELIDESVELVAEKGEPISAELLAESDKPAKSDELKPLPPKIVPAETDSQPVLELEADPRAQFQDNCRKVAAGPLSSGLQAAIATGSFAFAHALVTHHKISHLPIAIGLFVFAIVFRMLYIRWRANSQAKTKFSLHENWLTASGPGISKDWKIHVSNLDRATLISGSNKKKSLVLTTSTNTRVLRGLEDPEKLFLSLPREIQVDTSALEQKLQEFADSVFDCKDAEEVALLRDAEHVQTRATESIQEFPEARFLKQDLSGIVLITIVTALFVCGCLAVAHFGYSQYSLPLLPFVMVFYLPTLRSLLRTVDCLYVFSADALFELDRKNGLVHAITLDRVSIRGSVSEGESLYIDNQTGLPVHIEKEDSAYFRRCLKKYPNSD